MKRVRRHPQRDGGFMLLEMFVALILLTAFALVATQLFTWSMRILREAPQAQQEMTRFETMLDTLRADVWSAERIEVLDDQHLRLHLTDSGAVEWSLDRSTITRSGEAPVEASGDSNAPQTWPNLRFTVRFKLRDGVLIALLTDNRRRVDDEMWMMSGAMSR